jgi:long-chain acyl-CoA synthetase
VSYGQLAERSARCAGLLRARGVSTGDRVGVMLPNGPEFVALLYGAWRLGAVVVPLNVLLAEPEVAARVAVVSTKVLIRDTAELESGEPLHDVIACDPAAPAVILFTSGTSGKPKGATLTHGSVRAASTNAAAALQLGSRDVVLGAAPFSHVLGLSTGIVATLSHGGAIAIERRFDARQTLALMAEAGVTVLLGVPTMCIALSEVAGNAERLPALRIAHVGGAAVPAEVGATFEEVFGADVYEGYGMTEMSGIATTYSADQLRKLGSVGVPLGGTEIRIDGADERGVGEVCFRGPSVIPGYWHDPKATSEAISPDGWLATGDMGYVDDDGYLFLVDRKKELINRGGYKVYPREVEEVLYAHPDVLEAVVIGIPDDRLGEEVVAIVVPRAGATPTPDGLRDWTRERVAAYKYPRRVVVAETLPKGPTGKILKRAIDVETLFAS